MAINSIVSVKKKIIKLWRGLGPGLVTGASDDDPSGLVTYSIAGARFGNSGLWTMLYLLPFMTALQEMSARVGISSSCGLAGNIKRHYPKILLVLIALAILISNIFNIGANIAGMAGAIDLLLPGYHKIAGFFIVLLILPLIVFLSYRKIAAIFKWLALSLLAYVAAGFIAIDNWPATIANLLIPSLNFSKEYAIMLFAIIGTTISPYLVVWQASEEAEEKKLDSSRKTLVCKFRPVRKAELISAGTDTRFGMFFSNFIAFFVIALTSSVLFRAGINDIETIEQAASALLPLAGKYAYFLFTLGIVSSGLLAIPVLAGSSAYVIAETFDWPASLDRPFHKARKFYLIVAASTILGFLMIFSGISPIRALFLTAILHGLVSPFLLSVLIHMANNSKIVGANKTGFWGNFLGYGAVVLTAAGSILFITTL